MSFNPGDKVIFYDSYFEILFTGIFVEEDKDRYTIKDIEDINQNLFMFDISCECDCFGKEYTYPYSEELLQKFMLDLY